MHKTCMKTIFTGHPNEECWLNRISPDKWENFPAPNYVHDSHPGQVMNGTHFYYLGDKEQNEVTLNIGILNYQQKVKVRHIISF